MARYVYDPERSNEYRDHFEVYGFMLNFADSEKEGEFGEWFTAAEWWMLELGIPPRAAEDFDTPEQAFLFALQNIPTTGDDPPAWVRPWQIWSYEDGPIYYPCPYCKLMTQPGHRCSSGKLPVLLPYLDSEGELRFWFEVRGEGYCAYADFGDWGVEHETGRLAGRYVCSAHTVEQAVSYAVELLTKTKGQLQLI